MLLGQETQRKVARTGLSICPRGFPVGTISRDRKIYSHLLVSGITTTGQASSTLVCCHSGVARLFWTVSMAPLSLLGSRSAVENAQRTEDQHAVDPCSNRDRQRDP